MRVEGEVLGPEVLGCLVVRQVVEEDCSENGALGLYISWQSTSEVVVDSGHLKNFYW